jgi:hypothetical protein
MVPRGARTRRSYARATRTADIADAHVVICAKQHDDLIATSDPDDLRKLNPAARILAV